MLLLLVPKSVADQGSGMDGSFISLCPLKNVKK